MPPWEAKLGTRWSLDVIELLVRQYRCSPDPRHTVVEQGATAALGLAASSGFVNIAMTLIEAGADVSRRVQSTGCAAGRHQPDVYFAPDSACPRVTALENAASAGWLDMVQLLLDAGAAGVQGIEQEVVEDGQDSDQSGTVTSRPQSSRPRAAPHPSKKRQCFRTAMASARKAKHTKVFARLGQTSGSL
jgi:hypothetical protein